MPKSFSQFKARVREKSNLTAEERAIVKAFQKGEEAGRSDAPRRAPYAPESEQEKFEAWQRGYDEQATRYAIAISTDRPKSGATRSSVHG